MRTIKRLAAFVIITAGLFGILSSVASAFGSSITYGTFLQIIGNNLQPQSTLQAYTSQVQSPAITAASSTSGGSLTGGPIVFQVAATTLTGTSSPSNEIATTTNPSTQTYISWPPIPGASAYVLYVGTTTSGSEQSYLLATSTNGVPNAYYDLTSTSSVNFYAIPQQGSGYYTSEGSATTSVDTTGLIRSQSSATTSCSVSLNGAIFYNPNNAHLWLCTGAGPTWTLIK